MRNITKDDKGITLVALILTIIIMIILISITTYSGIDAYRNTLVTKFVTQMQLIQTKVDEIVESGEIERLGETNITDNQKSIIDIAYSNQEIQNNDKTKYIFFSAENLREELNLTDIEDDILVNFETREVISLNGIEYEGNKYYTQYKLPKGQTVINSNSTTRNLSFNAVTKVDGLNCMLTIKEISITNGSLSFVEENLQNWKTITNYTEKDKEYKINITKSGNYILKLKDNTDSNNYIESNIPISIILTNKPKTNNSDIEYNYGNTSENWAYCEDSNGVNYVWIPRFAYKVNEDTDEVEDRKFIKGNSNIATDESYINNDWVIHSKFSDNDIELTGIWIEVNQANQTGLDMIELLNSNANTLTEINIEE